MGKRKERRLAAMSAAGRRVKLDLFAEPSGEMVSTSLHDEDGGILDQDHHARVPISPSSTGQRQENPLLLLGQYSDDDVDEEANKQPEHAVDGSSSTAPDGQVQEPVDAILEMVSQTVKDMHKEEPDQVDTVKKLDSNNAKESDVTPESAPCSEVADLPSQICTPVACEMQVDGDVAGGWKMVLHEQSNRYYYWNVVTGETSWEVPSALALDTLVSGEQSISSAIEESTSMPSNTDAVAYAYVAAVDGNGGGDPISNHAADYGNGLEIGKENGEVAHLSYDANHSLAHYSTGVTGVSYHSTAIPDYGSSEQSKNARLEQLTTPLEEPHVSSGEYKDKHFTDPSDCFEITAHSTRLVKYSENLLERLKALDRSGYHLEGHEWIMKEIEIRLSDCKALSSYGPSLLPFWWHTETQLQHLESAISKEEACLLTGSKDFNRIEPKDLSQIGTGPQKPSPRNESKDILFTFESKDSSPSNDVSVVKGEASSEIPDGDDVKTKCISSGSTHQHSKNEHDHEVVLEPNPRTVPVDLVPITDPHAEEDVDMDVEMEVDEEIPAGQTAAGDTECPAPSEELFQTIPSSSDFASIPADESSVPPPPDEEWIPPPPPDSELVPPPPPEEPPTPFPLPYTDTILCPPYQEQYNLGYTVPTYEYYAPTVGEVTNGNYYAHAEGSHMVEPQPPPYYEPVVANGFPEVPVDVNLVEPVAYYDISSATVPPIPVVSTIESSGFYMESGPISYNVTVSALDPVTSLGFAMEPENKPLPNVNLEPGISGVAMESETGGLQAPSISSTAQAAETALMNGSTMDVLPSANSRNQSKVTRSKKRTLAVAPTLRSNKKVSSLVDKWKAAKEELHGEEDEEPDDPNEILEKKRQKEIEKWRARQIASGEAQENANFLPLGGDWRERVKRKKAAAKAEVQASSHAAENEKRQPDLVELSKDLPSGWQAYWDESTKQAYYGNSITSETSWTRPTR